MTREQNVCDRISQGIFYNKNFKIYTKAYLNDILRVLEEQEDFENCLLLKYFIKKRFKHIKNYKKSIL